MQKCENRFQIFVVRGRAYKSFCGENEIILEFIKTSRRTPRFLGLGDHFEDGAGNSGLGRTRNLL